MKNNSKRMVVYISDVHRITGKSTKACYTIYKRIQKHYNKLPKAFITIKQFCEYMGFEEEEIEGYIT